MDRAFEEFYHRFEDRFRGSSQLIEDRWQQRYGNWLQEIHQPGARAVDLGCGRGEFLELLKQVGFETVGVDANASMVRGLETKGHQVFTSDSREFLSAQPEGHFQLISLMHLLEHCTPEEGFHLVRTAARATAPGGWILCETPSAVSLWSAARQFCLDPTHRQPVHPDYLSFLLEDSGFRNVHLRFFDPVEHFEKAEQIGSAAEWGKLEKWLYGPMDVACLGQK